MRKNNLLIALGTALLLMIPLMLTIRDGAVEGVGWNWTLFDFVFMGTLIFCSGLAYQLIASRGGSTAYRAAVGLGVVTAFLLLWINAAVGIIGTEGDFPNMLYSAVPLVGIIGACITRLEARGLAWTLCAMALTQMLIPVVAWIVKTPSFERGVMEVFALNGVFAMMWLGSALLFRQAARKGNIATL